MMCYLHNFNKVRHFQQVFDLGLFGEVGITCWTNSINFKRESIKFPSQTWQTRSSIKKMIKTITPHTILIPVPPTGSVTELLRPKRKHTYLLLTLRMHINQNMWNKSCQVLNLIESKFCTGLRKHAPGQTK